MADIFLSYSRVDRPKAEQIAKTLEAEGYTVWWDKILRAGQTYDEVTEGMLRDAKVVIVLWSEVSVKSKWVRAEATLGERSSTLIPASIQQADRPIMFELLQTADLIGWDGDIDDPRWRRFVSDIGEVLARQPAPESLAAQAPPPPDANIEATFWTSIEDSIDPADFEAYLERYPDGHFAALAANRLAAMATSAAGAVTPEPMPPVPEGPPVLPTETPSAAVHEPVQATPKSKGSPLPVILLGLLLLGGLGAGAYVMVGPEASQGADPTSSEIVATSPATLSSPFKDCDTCPDMVVIQAGEYARGAKPGSFGFEPGDAYTGDIAVPSFALGQTEVTYANWNACVAAGACPARVPDNHGSISPEETAALPVYDVSWSDAQTYVRWLTASNGAGRRYRLPSEAEWEYAARAGTDTLWWWGNSFRQDLMTSTRAAPAASSFENPWGLKGMIGNLREWVQDCHVPGGYPDDVFTHEAIETGICSRRMLRGGSFRTRQPAYFRAANRAYGDPNMTVSNVGFRVATSDLTVN